MTVVANLEFKMFSNKQGLSISLLVLVLLSLVRGPWCLVLGSLSLVPDLLFWFLVVVVGLWFLVQIRLGNDVVCFNGWAEILFWS